MAVITMTGPEVDDQMAEWRGTCAIGRGWRRPADRGNGHLAGAHPAQRFTAGAMADQRREPNLSPPTMNVGGAGADLDPEPTVAR